MSSQKYLRRQHCAWRLSRSSGGRAATWLRCWCWCWSLGGSGVGRDWGCTEMMHTHRLSCKALGNSGLWPVTWDKNLLEALMQGGGDAVDLDGAVVGRGGIKPKGVAHNVKLGSLERPLMWRWWRRFSRRLLQPWTIYVDCLPGSRHFLWKTEYIPWTMSGFVKLLSSSLGKVFWPF